MIRIEFTPSQDAKKFICPSAVINQGDKTYKEGLAFENNELARALFDIAGVLETYFFENKITVTKSAETDWNVLESDIIGTIEQFLPEHDIKLNDEIVKQRDPELRKIDDILDQTIRPALAGDGGGLELIGLDGNTLTINYQGACGACPSAIGGTLNAINGILRERYNPDLTVEVASMF
jgi:NFU1 iron-sulfur cluster scaffold homolog, mitochondrial